MAKVIPRTAFKPGQSGNPKGKPKGLKNKATIEIKELSRRLLTDPAYVASLKERLIEGKAPHMETLLHHYAYGKPKDSIELGGLNGGPLSLAGLSIEVVHSGANGNGSGRH